MSFTDDWLDTYKRVLTQPTEFFKSEDKRDGFGFSLKFALVNLLISGIIGAASTATIGSAFYGIESAAGSLGIALLSAGILVLTPIVGILGLMISSGIIHIFASLLGAEQGYSETLSAMEYATAIQPITSLFSMVPLLGSLVNFLVGLYGLFIQTRALENFQNLSVGRALAAILLPAFLILGLVLLVVVLVLGASFASVAAA